MNHYLQTHRDNQPIHKTAKRLRKLKLIAGIRQTQKDALYIYDVLKADANFKRADNLQQHIRRVHTPGADIASSNKCPHCPKPWF